MTESPTLATASEFIMQATESDLSRIVDAVKQRRVVLGALRAAAVTKGSVVRLDRLNPKYLNGLTGVVVEVVGQAATVCLDEDSTDQLRYAGRRGSRRIPDEVTSYALEGVPLKCCFPVS